MGRFLNNDKTIKDVWQTPKSLVQEVKRLFQAWTGKSIEYDAACTDESCVVRYGARYPDIDFFDIPLSFLENKNVFCNPPYGSSFGTTKGQWLERLAKLPNVVVLVPSSTGTKWYQRALREFDGVFLLNQRVKFVGAENGAPFDCALFCNFSDLRKMRDEDPRSLDRYVADKNKSLFNQSVFIITPASYAQDTGCFIQYTGWERINIPYQQPITAALKLKGGKE